MTIAALLREVLGDEGIRTHLVSTFDAAEDVIRRDRVDFIIIDLDGRSYGEHSWEPIRRLSSSGIRVPVLVYTTNVPGSREDPSARGVTVILPKPFDLNELIDHVLRALGRSTQDAPARPSANEPTRLGGDERARGPQRRDPSPDYHSGEIAM